MVFAQHACANILPQALFVPLNILLSILADLELVSDALRVSKQRVSKLNSKRH